MATDGVKIIDGDTAYCVYGGIMDLYDNGKSLDEIQKSYPFPEKNSIDEFDNEIYTTAYALAIWEIGEMTADILKVVKSVIDKGACVREWTEEWDEETGKQRKEELDKFWKKINKTNLNIRERKTYEKVKNYIFNINDILVFKLPFDKKNEKYYTTVILNISQHRGICDYTFGKILCVQKVKPTIENVINSKIIGRKTPYISGNMMNNLFTTPFEDIMKQGGVEKVIKKEATKSESFDLGMSGISIKHEVLEKIKNNFEKIGNINLIEACKEISIGTGAKNFDRFAKQFINLKKDIEINQAEKINIKNLIK